MSNGKPYSEVEAVLTILKLFGLKIGLLTDVAYGMDDEFALKDIEPLSKYIDATITSVNVGYRKPNGAGFKMLSEALMVKPCKMLFVGDEEKDISGANSLDIVSVLINRSGERLSYGQKHVISSLEELFPIIENYNRNTHG